MRKTLRSAMAATLGAALVSTAMAMSAPPALASDIVTTVRDTAAGVVASGPQVAETVETVLRTLPTQCNDGIDNDHDGWTDSSDLECTSAMDNTEAPIRIAAYGTITIETDAANQPRMTVTGVFSRPEVFRCTLLTSPVEAVCRQVPNTEFLYTCTHFVLTAKAYSTSKQLGPGSAKGYVQCDNPTALTTADVNSSQNLLSVVAEADNVRQKIDLGTGNVVRCRAMGVNGADNPTGAYTVDCNEPGVAWPVDTVADPRG